MFRLIGRLVDNVILTVVISSTLLLKNFSHKKCFLNVCRHIQTLPHLLRSTLKPKATQNVSLSILEQLFKAFPLRLFTHRLKNFLKYSKLVPLKLISFLKFRKCVKPRDNLTHVTCTWSRSENTAGSGK